MAVAEAELRQAEMEHDNLQNTISEMRTALAFATVGSRPVLEKAIQNATGRLGVVAKRIRDTRTELEAHARQEVEAISYKAQKEAALSARERETFDGFLKVDYFTKKDFGRLEDFYAKTWDRLSESGKDEMSYRVWEGIRRDEYKFTELPKVIQEKESERAYSVFKKRETGLGVESKIPQADRDDFIRAYESGERDKACEILNRKSFREYMFVGNSSPEMKENAATLGRGADAKNVAANASVPPTTQPAHRRVKRSASLMLMRRHSIWKI